MIARYGKAIVVAEVAAVGSAFYVFHRMNTSYEFRGMMSKKCPPLVRGFSAATGWKPEDDLAPRKQSMRKKISKQLSRLSNAEVLMQSNAIVDRIASLEEMRQSSAVSVYVNMPRKEVVTFPRLISWLFEEGKAVYIPKVYGPGNADMKMLRVQSLAHFESFETNCWGIPEPSDADAALMDDAALTGEVDLVLVPGVAFDSECRRLGHGRGYYDYFLTSLHEARLQQNLPDAKTIGLAMSDQIIDSVPVGSFDKTLDIVITPVDTFHNQNETTPSLELPR